MVWRGKDPTLLSSLCLPYSILFYFFALVGSLVTWYQPSQIIQEPPGYRVELSPGPPLLFWPIIANLREIFGIFADAFHWLNQQRSPLGLKVKLVMYLLLFTQCMIGEKILYDA